MDLRDALREAVLSLTEEQAQQVVDFIQDMRRKAELDRIRQALANEPGISVPARVRKDEPFEPIKGRGIPASKLLINDRR